MTKPAVPIWGTYQVEDLRRVKKLKLGPLTLWLHSTRREVRLAFRNVNPAVHEQAIETETAEPESWIRWTNEDREAEVQLQPVFSDLPLVARPNDPLFIGRETKAKIYVRVPVWCRVVLHSNGVDRISMELPSLILSKTWSGTTTEGELCYWAPTSARREYEESLFEPHLVICPVEISNDSGEELQVERLCLRVAHLSIFDARGQMWSDLTEVSFAGGRKVSGIGVSGKPPAEAARAQLVGKPRIPEKRSFSARTFSWIKDIPGFSAIV